jgi:hypothetical protein
MLLLVWHGILIYAGMTNSITTRKIFSAISIFLTTIFCCMSVVMIIDYFINKDASAIMSPTWRWAYLIFGASAILITYIKRRLRKDTHPTEVEHEQA